MIREMSATLLPHLRCPECGQTLAESAVQTLTCRGCRPYQFPDPRWRPAFHQGRADFTRGVTDTAVSFGYMWGEQAAVVVPPTTPSPYHLAVMQEALAPPLPGPDPRRRLR